MEGIFTARQFGLGKIAGPVMGLCESGAVMKSGGVTLVLGAKLSTCPASFYCRHFYQFKKASPALPGQNSLPNNGAGQI
jgi:hypothetical protein